MNKQEKLTIFWANMMNGPNGPELDRVNLPNVHEREERPKRAVGHHLAFRILPALNNRGLEG